MEKYDTQVTTDDRRGKHLRAEGMRKDNFTFPEQCISYLYQTCYSTCKNCDTPYETGLEEHPVFIETPLHNKARSDLP